MRIENRAGLCVSDSLGKQNERQVGCVSPGLPVARIKNMLKEGGYAKSHST